MSLKDEIEKSMLRETYNTRLANIADLVGETDDEVRNRMETLDFKYYVDLMRALRDRDENAAKEILGIGIEEAYSTGSQGSGGTLSPSETNARKAGMTQQSAAAPQAADSNADEPSAAQKTQGMARLGKKNIGDVTPSQAAQALDKAGEGKPLSPIQRKAMAMQAHSVNALAADPKTAGQFRQLLNKLNK
jgi:hypothetical protein|tara:strand:+ start:1316 stop:1885 length:570 start_codon:yes stop_codon:yes gene_type:complete